MTRTLLALALTALLLGGSTRSVAAQEANCDADDTEKRVKYSLYFENYKAGAYDAALPDLVWILECAPAFGGPNPDDRNFRRAAEIYDSLAVRAQTPEERQENLQQALAIYDNAVSTLQDIGAAVDPYDWLLRKGRFVLRYPEDLTELQAEVDDYFYEAIQLKPEEIGDYYVNYVAGVRANEAITANTPEGKREARAFIETELVPLADDPSYIQEHILPSLISTPREQFDYLYAKYQQNPDGLSDDEVMELFEMNQRFGGEFFANDGEESAALRHALIGKVAELNPTYPVLTSLGRASLDEGNQDQAIEFFERAQQLAENDEQRRDAFYNIALVKEQQGQKATAANYAREALALDGSHAPSLYLIGSLIQSSVGGGDARARAGYWCAADYFNRAAAAASDADLAASARRAAAGANSAAPNSEEYFFLGWRPGQTVQASYGWGNCSTTVR